MDSTYIPKYSKSHYEKMMGKITSIKNFEGYLVKMDNEFELGNIKGGKVRQCLSIVHQNLDRFIGYKKLISLFLLPTLTLLCVFSFIDWYNFAFLGIGTSSNIDFLFFVDFFTILILVDVFICLLYTSDAADED